VEVVVAVAADHRNLPVDFVDRRFRFRPAGRRHFRVPAVVAVAGVAADRRSSPVDFVDLHCHRADSLIDREVPEVPTVVVVVVVVVVGRRKFPADFRRIAKAEDSPVAWKAAFPPAVEEEEESHFHERPASADLVHYHDSLDAVDCRGRYCCPDPSGFHD
jgi:hypothetical protein